MHRPSRNAAWSLVILLVQVVFVGVWLGATGRFHPRTVPDTAGYDAFPWQSWEAALSYRRTPAYPAFLQLCRVFSQDHRDVPAAHFAVYSAAVVILFLGMGRVTSSYSTACAGASILLYSRILHGYVDNVATETVAAAAGIAVCGFTLWRISGGGAIANSCLALAVITGWLIRPAYLFLVPLAPALTWLLDPLRSDTITRSRWREMTLVLALSVGPVAGYSLLRYCVVGRLGVVSYGGYAQIGVCGQFLDEADLTRLPADLQPVARSALELLSSGTLPTRRFDSEPRLHYLRMEERYDVTIWYQFVPAAEQWLGTDSLKVDATLRRLAAELIRLHPGRYAVWIAKATRQSVKKVLWDFADNPVTLALLIAGIPIVCQRKYVERVRSEPMACTASASRILLVVAVPYLVLNLMVVIPVCPPLGRFTDAAALLLAVPLAVWLVDSPVPPGRLSAVAANRTSSHHRPRT